MAASADQIMELMRGNIFARAVVAIEFSWNGEPIVSRIAKLPSMRLVVVVGPPDDPDTETLARISGADTYLPRPVTIESLAKALLVSSWDEPAGTPRRQDTASLWEGWMES